MIKGIEPFYFSNKTHFSFFPATRSRTATLLRLHPNHQFLNEFYKVKFSIQTDFLHVAGGVYKAN